MVRQWPILLGMEHILAAWVRYQPTVGFVIGENADETISILIPEFCLRVLFENFGRNQETITAVVVTGGHGRVLSTKDRLAGNGVDAIRAHDKVTPNLFAV